MSGPSSSAEERPLPRLPDPTGPTGEERVIDEAADGSAALAELADRRGDNPADRSEDNHGSERSRLLKSSAVVGVGTGLSRLSGLIRVLALIYALQFTTLSDAYTLANITPNIIYELVLGGVLSATLIPVFVERHELGDDRAIDTIVSWITVVLVGLSLVTVVAAPWIFRLFTLDASPQDAATLSSVGVPLVRLFAPQIFFYGLTAVGTALLNSRKHFAVPAYAPILNNIVLVCILIEVRHVAGGVPQAGQVLGDTTLMLLLGLGTTAGIAAMTVVLWPAIRRAGIRLRPRLDWREPALRTVARLSGWTLGYVIANQVAFMVVAALAYASGEGNATRYNYAFTFFQLPHGLLAVSIMTTYMPGLAELASRHDLAGFRHRFMEGGRLLFVLVLPAAVGLTLLAQPLMAAMFSFLHFQNAGPLTAEILQAFAVGLPGFSVYLYVLRGFYAIKDTRTPFFVNLVENVINVALAFALLGTLSVQGLALSYSAAYVVGAAAAFVLLRRQVGALWSPALARSTGSAVLAAGCMGVAVWAVASVVGTPSGTGALVRCLAGVLAGAIVYFGVLVALRSDDVEGLTRRLRRRPAPAAP